jgi:hypothetical protein
MLEKKEHSKSANSTMYEKSARDEEDAKNELHQMANIIRKLNEEKFPCYIMNLVRRKINIELIKLEETD